MCVYVCDPGVLLLDEATSALDSESEEEVGLFLSVFYVCVMCGSVCLPV
jgi:ABC-type bacteriocin/lantibiotic exporter with double-glycine peptidase domain